MYCKFEFGIWKRAGKEIYFSSQISQLLERLGTVYSTVWCTVQCTEQCTVHGTCESWLHYRYVGCPDTCSVVTSKAMKTKFRYIFWKLWYKEGALIQPNFFVLLWTGVLKLEGCNFIGCYINVPKKAPGELNLQILI